MLNPKLVPPLVSQISQLWLTDYGLKAREDIFLAPGGGRGDRCRRLGQRKSLLEGEGEGGYLMNRR